MKFSHYLWAIYIIVYPFYIFSEGNPQMADIFGAVLILANIKSILTSIKANRFTKNLFLFVVYTFIVNAIWMLILGEVKVLKNSIFYLYSFFLTLIIFNKIKDKSFLIFTYKAMTLALITQTVLWPLIRSQGVRTQMFFNNPNQLALWGICLLIIIYVIAQKLKTKTAYLLPQLMMCTLFILISASRAALLGCIAFWMFFIIKSRKHVIIFGVLSILAFIIIDINYDFNLNEFAAFEYNMDRFSNNTISGNQSIGNRGFNRITENPQYLLFGAGEGVYTRFNDTIELHSIFLNVLFCYGIIGMVLYLGAFSVFTKKITKEIITLLFVIGLFGAVHMTLRIPLFWITLLFVIYLHKENIRTDNLISTD